MARESSMLEPSCPAPSIEATPSNDDDDDDDSPSD
ncbi:hypothetical protein MY8738_003484 [Beauveria namnaoensis]